ncbi:hypothetical protein [Thermomonospora cellulosilytica]|uniref:Uncharacterized protein n=1 Tax=Thermomonospora cellulosilytica TaxID=1411118 RepID=A0A7W3MZN3_9ACTN|nr:hypothetical protein [Thermomonospora cellulosilytica]MBA9004824.1 hypothetical protein [Thermomonospora cellulosilytica]
MTVTLADLTARTGLDVLDHLEREVTVPVIDGLQAQGDLIVIPRALVPEVTVRDTADWRRVPPSGLELLRSASGGNPHTLVADAGTCRWTTDFWDVERLALGVLQTSAPAYLVHPEHGGTGIAPGAYVVRRQREGSGPSRRGSTFLGGVRLVVD